MKPRMISDWTAAHTAPILGTLAAIGIISMIWQIRSGELNYFYWFVLIAWALTAFSTARSNDHVNHSNRILRRSNETLNTIIIDLEQRNEDLRIENQMLHQLGNPNKRFGRPDIDI